MAAYKCEKCGMSIGTMTCGACNKELRHSTLTKPDGSAVHISECPDGHGKVKSLREIEGRIVPPMQNRGANYLGPEFDPGTAIYRLKFMRNGRVIWVDVDAATGRIIRRSRP